MSKSVHNDVLDAALDHISTNCDKLTICSQAPTTYAEANATYALGSKTSPSFGANADGDTSGRKKPVSAISDGSVTADGTANHIALIDTGSSVLLYVTEITTPQVVSNGNTFTLTEWDVEIEDPT
jgi:hypothetical protein